MNTVKVRLTGKEQTAVDALIAAAKAMPKTLCIEFNRAPYKGEPNLTVSKRKSKCFAQQVAALRKKSLCF